MATPAGLEPVTSAVTGRRSNQLSYRPIRAPRAPHYRTRASVRQQHESLVTSMTFTDTTVAIFHRSRLYSSIKDTRTPPTNEAMMLYRNAPSVDIAVIMMTLATAAMVA